MAKTIGRLTAQQVESPALEPRRHSDGGNLYLDVRSDGGRSWLFIYRWQGKQREAGLGKAGKGAVSLKDARQMAKQGRALLDQRPPVDPLSVWRAAPEKRAPTFAEASANYLSLHEPSWKNAKHAQQWRNTLASYCKPIHKLPVDQIGAEDVRSRS